MSRFRAPSKTSARRNDGPRRPRSRQDGPRRQRSRQDGPNRRRSRPGRRLDARNQRQSHRNRDLPAAPPVRRRTAGQPPDLLARPNACRPRPAPPPCSTDRVWLLTGRVGGRCALQVARFSGAHGEAHRRTVFLACPRFFLVLPRARAAFPLALCDLRPVTFPTSSSTRPASRSTAPSVLLRRALLNIVLPRFSHRPVNSGQGRRCIGAMAAIDRRYPHPRLTMRESRHAGEPRPAPRSKLGNVTPGRVRH